MIYLIVWAHFVCDFILQSDKMARGKSSSNSRLAEHIGVYTLALMACVAFKTTATWDGVFLYGLVNGTAHFATDYVTSRITKKLWAANRVHDFFVVVGLDQAMHMTTLFVTLPLLTWGAS